MARSGTSISYLAENRGGQSLGEEQYCFRFTPKRSPNVNSEHLQGSESVEGCSGFPQLTEIGSDARWSSRDPFSIYRVIILSADGSKFTIGWGKRMLRDHLLRAGVSLLTVFAALCSIGCGSEGKNNTQAGPPPPTVQVAVVHQRDVSLTSEWIATMDGFVNSQIRPQVSGYLIRQDYREGSFVHKGELLFEIDPRTFQATLEQSKAQLLQAEAQVGQAKAQLAKAEQDVNRDLPLAAAKAIAQSELDNDLQAKAGAVAAVAAAEAAVEAARAAVQQAQLNLSFTKVVSLIDGVAGIAQAQVGDLVSISTVLTSVSQVDPIKVYFPMSEQDYLLAQKIRMSGKSGQVLPLEGVPLTLLLADGSAYPFPGKVLWTDRQVDTSTGTIRVAAAFPNKSGVLRPGQYGRVRAVTEMRHNAVLLPQAAVTELQGTFQVAVVGPDNKVNIQKIQIGSQVGSEWIVSEGLEPGDRVIVGGMQYARPGAAVNPQPISATPAGGR
jgi:RND family efflux transporter MFP subunit